jgi:hypothetical protein
MRPRNTPFLSIHDLFILKRAGNEADLARWRDGDVAARRALPPKVEWFFTSRRLCALAADVGEARAMWANPGPARSEDWEAFTYKGGSEAVVIGVTHQLLHADGRRFCVTGAWNDDKPAKIPRFILIAAGANEFLR